jgi:hypothetical protein
MIPACSTKPASASSRQAGSPHAVPTAPPSAAPIGRAPALTVRNTADTRPSIAEAVTLCRSVVVVMVQTIGPAPNRKNDSAASDAAGTTSVAAMAAAATTATAGPTWIARPNGRRANTREVSSAPATMPAPYIASVKPTACAPRPSTRTAYGT